MNESRLYEKNHAVNESAVISESLCRSMDDFIVSLSKDLMRNCSSRY